MPDLTAKKKRPLWYNLSPLNLPVPGLVSIFHRVSGVALFLGLVAFLYLLDLSLASESGYAQAGEGPRTPIAQPPVVSSLWAPPPPIWPGGRAPFPHRYIVHST